VTPATVSLVRDGGGQLQLSVAPPTRGGGTCALLLPKGGGGTHAKVKDQMECAGQGGAGNMWSAGTGERLKLRTQLFAPHLAPAGAVLRPTTQLSQLVQNLVQIHAMHIYISRAKRAMPGLLQAVDETVIVQLYDEVKSCRPVNFTDSKTQSFHESSHPVAAEVPFAEQRAAPSPTKALLVGTARASLCPSTY